MDFLITFDRENKNIIDDYNLDSDEEQDYDDTDRERIIEILIDKYSETEEGYALLESPLWPKAN